MNGDGLMDLIVGDREGFVNYYTRSSDGTLHTQPDMLAGGSVIDVGGNSAPVVVDWDNDGLLDLVLGSEGTYPGGSPIRLYLNSGTASSYLFTTWSSVFCGDTDILFYRCVPTVADLDMDGMKDLLLGTDAGNLWFCGNDGSDAAPHFSDMVQIQTASGPIQESYGLRACVDNWDESGAPDILTSDYDGFVRLYLASTTGIGHSGGGVPEGGALQVCGSPTAGSFWLSFTLGFDSSVEVGIFSQDGRRVARALLGEMEQGSHSVPLDISGNPPGIYLLRCSTDEGVMIGRVVLTE